MSPQTTGLLIGGLLPALAFTASNLFFKASNQAGIGIGPYMITIGIAVMLVGIILFLFFPDSTISLRSGIYAFGMGVSWGIGASLAGIAVARYGVPIGKIAPLFNMNTLFTVLLALWIFAEWREVHVPRLLTGTALIVLGGILVARS